MKTLKINYKTISAAVAFLAMGFSANAQNTFPSNGNVGVGITTPLYPVHIVTSAHYGSVTEGSETHWAGTLVKGTGTYSQPFYEYQTANGAAAWTYMNTSGDWKLNTGGLDRFTVANTGFVGINTASPQTKLHLDLAGEPSATFDGLRIHFDKTKTVTRADIGYDGSPGAFTIHSYAGGGSFATMSFKTNNTTKMYISSGGNVGIGTVHPASLLSVAGVITAQEIIVQDVGADYVFDEKYKLKSLSEVETFVKANKHLPGIAPASETEKGIKVGEFNEKLLEKIEELTLYVIEANKEINTMKAKIAELESSTSK